MAIENKKLVIDTGVGIREFEIYPLAVEKDYVLQRPTENFDFANPPVNPVYLANSLFETMLRNKGLGLSANQCGLSLRVFVAGFDATNKQVFFNPKVLETSAVTELGEEGCLSFPYLFMKVKRPTMVRLAYQHVNGEHKEDTFHGLTARVILHECDHMDGITMDLRVGRTTLAMARDRRRKTIQRLSRKGNR